MTPLSPEQLIARVQAGLGRAAECPNDHTGLHHGAMLAAYSGMACTMLDVVNAARRLDIATPQVNAETVRALVKSATIALSLASQIEVPEGS